MSVTPSVPQPDDGALLRAVAQRIEPAMATFYDRHADRIYALVLRIVGDPDAAEEVTVDTFVRVWNHASDYDEQRGSPLAWLTTIARRLAIDHTRSRQGRMRRRFVSIDGDDPRSHAARARVEAPVHGGGGAGTPEAAEAREVRDALAELPEPLRRVLELAYFEGLSHAMIARHLDMPLGTVKSRLRDAIGRLRRRFAVGGGGR